LSANNQIVVAPFPKDLEKYAVWYDGCVDNPFDYSCPPVGVFDTLEEAVTKASKEEERSLDLGAPIEYGVHIILRSRVDGYERTVWDEFPDYKYLAMVPSTERR
jgi:hypothetical protein